MTDHPLTETSAEITDEMVEAAAREVYVHDAPSNDPQTWPPNPDALADDYRGAARAALTAALAVAPAKDDRPWETLNEGDPLNVGDEVKRVAFGATITAVVGHVDPEGDPWTAEDGFIGRRRHGAWHVRRLQDITLDTWKVDDQ